MLLLITKNLLLPFYYLFSGHLFLTSFFLSYLLVVKVIFLGDIWFVCVCDKETPISGVCVCVCEFDKETPLYLVCVCV